MNIHVVKQFENKSACSVQSTLLHINHFRSVVYVRVELLKKLHNKKISSE